jgi:predicted amidohydrolase
VIVVGIQLDISWKNKQANYDKVRTLLEGQSILPGSLIVLPEMFASGFSLDVEDISEGRDRQTEGFLSALAMEYGSFVVGGVVTQTVEGLGRNEAIVFDAEGTEVTRYCKLHPFSFAGEHNYYTPGNHIQVFQWQAFTVSPFICYDLRFPEAFRGAVGLGTTLFVVIANWPQVRQAHWETLLQARAIENQAYLIGVNRCGSDPHHSYSGGSLILDPTGKPLATAGAQETVIQANLEIGLLEEYRTRFPALADRRKDLNPDPLEG